MDVARIITALRFQEKDRDRVNVYLDGQFAFALPALAAARLRLGQALDEAEIAALQAIEAETSAYDRAVRFLGYRPRSIAEVRQHLLEHAVPASVAETVIQRLQQAGYLDDEGFARFWVDNRQQFRPRGERALRQELRRKGIDDAIIDAAIARAGVDEEEAAYALARGRSSRWKGLERRAFWQKGAAFLARRGYSYDVIETVLRRVWQEIQEEAEEETGIEGESWANRAV